jgi:hypothetical protein
VLQKVSYVTVQNLTFDRAGVNTSAFAIMVHATLTLTDGKTIYGIEILGNTIRNWGGDAAQAAQHLSKGALILNGGYCDPNACPGVVSGAVVRGNTFESNRGYPRGKQYVHSCEVCHRGRQFSQHGRHQIAWRQRWALAGRHIQPEYHPQ